MRTGAATGIATKYMAREDSRALGLIGAGWQAESQALAVSEARNLERILVYSRNPEKRAAFAERLGQITNVSSSAVASTEDLVAESDIIVSATTSRTPVFDGSLLLPGTHVNAVGSNSLARAEIDTETVKRASRIVVDSIEQSRVEAGDLLASIESRITRWEQIHELHEVVGGRHPG